MARNSRRKKNLVKRQRVSIPKRKTPIPGRWNQENVVLVHITSSRELPSSGELCCSYVTTDSDKASFFGASFDEGGSGDVAMILKPCYRGWAPVAAFTDDCYSNRKQGKRYQSFDSGLLETAKASGNKVPEWATETQRRPYVQSCATLKELVAKTGSGKKAAATAGEGRPLWLEDEYHHYNEVWVEASTVYIAGFARVSVGKNGETVITPFDPDKKEKAVPVPCGVGGGGGSDPFGPFGGFDPDPF